MPDTAQIAASHIVVLSDQGDELLLEIARVLVRFDHVA
jgi:hypothetical protein